MNKIKMLLAVAMIAAVSLAATSATAADSPLQSPESETGPGPAAPLTLSGPAWDALQFLGSGSNWMVAPYGIYNSTTHSIGGGIGVGYRVSNFVVPTMRVEYMDGQLWMPSLNLQLQAPIILMNKITLIPFASPGIATPLAGKGASNGQVVGIFAAGAAVRLDFLGGWGKHLDLIWDLEKWSGFKGTPMRIGLVYKLGF